jgi:predicted Rossmann fold nucleotide-binding protein DprA/Smf involved in DNA uptake
MSGTTLDLQTIAPTAPLYPAALKTGTAFRTAPTLSVIGNRALLSQPAIALFCSSQCPSDLISRTYELAEWLREAKIPVIGGFHSPIEQACLKILLGGSQPIIHCPARSLHQMQLSSDQQQAVAANRLLLVSPFSASQHRMTVKLAEKRNELVAMIAPIIFIAYAAPTSKTQALAQRLVQAQKTVVTFKTPDHRLGLEPSLTGLDMSELPSFLQRQFTHSAPPSASNLCDF